MLPLLGIECRSPELNKVLFANALSGTSLITRTSVCLSRDYALYYKMKRYAVTLKDYIDRIEANALHPDGALQPPLRVRMGLAIQICFGVLAGQRIFNLQFSDLKPENIMLDGSITTRYYPMSMGS